MAVFALLILLALAPLMRGGNRQVALIVLEALALGFLLALWATSARGAAAQTSLSHRIPLAMLASSPLWLALVYLTPLPPALWAGLAGRGDYLRLAAEAGVPVGGWLPLSLVPEATAASLFAGIPLVAAFLGGYLANLRQLRLLLAAIVALAVLQIVMGLLQMAGGSHSSLLFGGSPGRPFGTFANPNHFANYIAMALPAYAWLGWMRLTEKRQRGHWLGAAHPLSRHEVALWVAGGIVLALGILISRSRGAALAGLPAAMAAVALAMMVGARVTRWRGSIILVTFAFGAAVLLAGLEFVVARFEMDQLASSVANRAAIAASTMQGAAHFWPWGAGWGSYASVYPRFQPPSVTGFVDYAHQDYAQLLFEGGAFGLLLLAAFAWLAGHRTLLLARTAWQRGRLRREEMAAAICGLGLLGFLLHSLVDFSMHIPANAIVAALLAGAFLRPLGREEQAQGAPAEGLHD